MVSSGGFDPQDELDYNFTFPRCDYPGCKEDGCWFIFGLDEPEKTYAYCTLHYYGDGKEYELGIN